MYIMRIHCNAACTMVIPGSYFHTFGLAIKGIAVKSGNCRYTHNVRMTVDYHFIVQVLWRVFGRKLLCILNMGINSSFFTRRPTKFI